MLSRGIDLTHNPEFTTCEFYWAYADYEDVLKMTEDMISSLVKSVTGSYVTSFTTQTGEKYEVNWEAPWRRIDMIPGLEEACGEKFPPGDQLHTKETNEFLKRSVFAEAYISRHRSLAANIGWCIGCLRRPRSSARRQ